MKSAYFGAFRAIFVTLPKNLSFYPIFFCVYSHKVNLFKSPKLRGFGDFLFLRAAARNCSELMHEKILNKAKILAEIIRPKSKSRPGKDGSYIKYKLSKEEDS